MDNRDLVKRETKILRQRDDQFIRVKEPKRVTLKILRAEDRQNGRGASASQVRIQGAKNSCVIQSMRLVNLLYISASLVCNVSNF